MGFFLQLHSLNLLSFTLCLLRVLHLSQLVIVKHYTMWLFTFNTPSYSQVVYVIIKELTQLKFQKLQFQTFLV